MPSPIISKLVLGIFPLALPFVVAWVEEQERRILRDGVPLSARGLADARAVGVTHPDRVRLLKVREVPMPGNDLLQKIGKATGLVSPHTSGMALRYGIFVREDCWGDRHLIAHECVHTA